MWRKQHLDLAIKEDDFKPGIGAHNCAPRYSKGRGRRIRSLRPNRRRGPGTREKVRSKRINLEGNTHAQEINVSQLPV
jgi:hypothetical protein